VDARHTSDHAYVVFHDVNFCIGSGAKSGFVRSEHRALQVLEEVESSSSVGNNNNVCGKQAKLGTNGTSRSFE
jgi:hypothetical protein